MMAMIRCIATLSLLAGSAAQIPEPAKCSNGGVVNGTDGKFDGCPATGPHYNAAADDTACGGATGTLCRDVCCTANVTAKCSNGGVVNGADGKFDGCPATGPHYNAAADDTACGGATGALCRDVCCTAVVPATCSNGGEENGNGGEFFSGCPSTRPHYNASQAATACGADSGILCTDVCCTNQKAQGDEKCKKEPGCVSGYVCKPESGNATCRGEAPTEICKCLQLIECTEPLETECLCPTKECGAGEKCETTVGNGTNSTRCVTSGAAAASALFAAILLFV